MAITEVINRNEKINYHIVCASCSEEYMVQLDEFQEQPKHCSLCGEEFEDAELNFEE